MLNPTCNLKGVIEGYLLVRGALKYYPQHLLRKSRSCYISPKMDSSIPAANLHPIATNDKQSDSASNKVFVQCKNGSESMTISFKLSIDGRTKYFNLDRKPGEYLSTALERIKLNASKIKKPKKSMRNNQTNVEILDLHVGLYHDEIPVDPAATKNIDAWIDGAQLRVGEQKFFVGKNKPQTVSLKLPSPILKGFITVPAVDLINCDLETCSFEWYRQLSAKQRADFIKRNKDAENIISFEDRSYWIRIGDKFTYSPGLDDVAHILKCVCHPRDAESRAGLDFWSCSASPVELGPSMCPFEKRHEHTKESYEISDSRFRFMSYNILADLYADSDYSRTVLFAHCPPHALAIEYRRQLLLKEITGYNSDIICLQEMDRKEFKQFYEPYFRLVTGHHGIFHPKGGQVAEGVATFFRKDRFELIDSHRIVLNKLIDPYAKLAKKSDADNIAARIDNLVAEVIEASVEDPPQDQEYPHPILNDLDSIDAKQLLSNFDGIRSRIKSNLQLYKRFVDRHTVLQTSLLRVKGQTSKYLIVANTHLYFAPDADHIRLLQGCVCAKYLEYIKEHYAQLLVDKGLSNERPQLNVIFCGDMNSTPDCGLYSLMQRGSVDEHLKDWESNKDEKVIGLSFNTSLRLSSAYKDIEYTNYTPCFKGCLDYIYYEVDSFTLESTIPLPDHADVTKSGGIPSDLFPSDHIALIANLRFNKYT